MNEAIKNRIEQFRRGEVPQGYAVVLPYIIPSDWCVKNMGRLTTRIARPNREDTDLEAYSINNQVGFIPQSEQFEEGSYGLLDKSSYKIVNRGEFAYNPARINVGSIGRLKGVDKAIVSPLYVCFALNGENSEDYLEQWIQSFDFYKEVIRNLEGSVREYLFYENFSNIRIPLPSRTEQQKIADILSCCDQAIALKKQLLDEKRRQKQWLMQELLDTDSGVRVRGFEKSVWKKFKLADLGTFSKGTGISNEDCTSGEFPCIKYGDIYMTYDVSFCDAVSHTETDIASYSPHVEGGCLLFTGSGEDRLEIGKCTAYMGSTSLAVGGDIVIMKPNVRKVNPLFLAYTQFTDALIRQKARVSQGYSIVHLYADDIRKLVVDIPLNLEEQEAIIKILSAADREIDLLDQELFQWKRKKKSLMQLLLTGIVRVNV